MSHKDMFQVLELNKSVLKQFFGVMTEAEVHKRIRSYWTIGEHLSHLVDSQAVTVKRIELIYEQDAPRIVPFTPNDDDVKNAKKASTAELLETFCQRRDAQLKLLKKAKAADWAKTVTHPEYYRYSLEILVRHNLLHDAFHMARMEQLWIMKEDLIMELESN
jgi:hypothetical protein